MNPLMNLKQRVKEQQINPVESTLYLRGDE